MWASGSSGGPYIADDLALFDAAAGSDATPERAQMGIGRLVLGVVANFDEF